MQAIGPSAQDPYLLGMALKCLQALLGGGTASGTSGTIGTSGTSGTSVRRTFLDTWQHKGLRQSVVALICSDRLEEGTDALAWYVAAKCT
jgi:hypothetical protein